MVRFNIDIIGKLTKKQQQALETKKAIIRAFYDKDKEQRRTWNELKRLSKLSSGALSKHLKDLVKQGIIEGKIIIDKKNRMKTIFEHNAEKWLEIKGDVRDEVFTERNDVVRIDNQGVRWGHYKRAKAQTGDRKHAKYKPKGQVLGRANLIFQPETTEKKEGLKGSA